MKKGRDKKSIKKGILLQNVTQFQKWKRTVQTRNQAQETQSTGKWQTAPQ